MDAQVAGPSRIPAGFDSTRARQRQLASQQKAERVLGAPAPASFLKVDTTVREIMTKNTDSKQVILNSPVSRCPTTFLPWTSRVATMTTVTPTATPRGTTQLTQTSVAGYTISVPPLNFKRRPHRKSFSMAGIESEMTDFKRDAAQTFHDDEPNSRDNSQGSWFRPGDPCIIRRQSLPETSTSTLQPLMPSDGILALKRHPRPLPPVPLSRPVSPASSICSSPNSHNSPRPLPTPPNSATIPSPPCSASAHVKLGSSSTSSHSESPASPHEQELSSEPNPRPASDLFSPISTLSIITDLPTTLRVPSAPSPRSSEARKRHRIHASPYKLARNPTRYSTTSLSSQVSVPPVPPPAELRRRNREKMAKLIRMLGESPPTDLVFGIEQDTSRDSVETSITEESLESTPPVALDPLRRSASLGTRDFIASPFGKKKALSDPDAGHGERAMSPTRSRFPPPSSFKRLRPKQGRADKDKAPRYVLSLFDTNEEKTSERLAFKLNANDVKLRPTGSYLRGAYKTDARPVEEKTPSLLIKVPVPSIDSPKPAQKWVREAGLTRWEVDDYENVVMSLRKL